MRVSRVVRVGNVKQDARVVSTAFAHAPIAFVTLAVALRATKPVVRTSRPAVQRKRPAVQTRRLAIRAVKRFRLSQRPPVRVPSVTRNAFAAAATTSIATIVSAKLALVLSA